VRTDLARAGGRRSTLLAEVAVSAAAIFAGLAVAVTTGKARGVDRAIRRWLHRQRSRGVEETLSKVTWTGVAPVHLPFAVLAGLFVAVRRPPARGAPIVLSSVASLAVHHALKPLFRRRRPPRARLLERKTEPSFPSGHTTSSTAVALTTAYVLLRERLAPAAAVVPATLLLAGVVGASRAYLDEHWPTDVTAGWSAGLAVAAACALMYEQLAHTGARRSALSRTLSDST
jgi:undecaprenyl-diphosphatase